MENKGSYDQIKLVESNAVASMMEERHILDDDIKQVIYNAETTGEKLYQPEEENKYLAKMRLKNATFYVEYSIAGDNYIVHTVYHHGSEIIEG